MLRRSPTALMLRRTPITRGGAKMDPIMNPAECPPAEEVTGMFGKQWNGEQKMLRIFDPLWLHNRVSQLHREAYIACLFFWPITWYVFWGLPVGMKWNDASPPRNPDWNQKQAGHLPANFKMTELK